MYLCICVFVYLFICVFSWVGQKLDGQTNLDPSGGWVENMTDGQSYIQRNVVIQGREVFVMTFFCLLW